jgi:ketosteroid isomerase-like protein
MLQTSRRAQEAAPLTDPLGSVVRFYRAIDDHDYPAMLRLLTSDVVWRRQGIDLKGEAEIMAAMAKRSPTLRVRHILTNICTSPLSDAELDVSAYLLVVLHDSQSEPTGPSPLAGIDSIRTARVRLRQQPDGWRIAHVSSDPPVFSA